MSLTLFGLAVLTILIVLGLVLGCKFFLDREHEEEIS